MESCRLGFIRIYCTVLMTYLKKVNLTCADVSSSYFDVQARRFAKGIATVIRSGGVCYTDGYKDAKIHKVRAEG